MLCLFVADDHLSEGDDVLVLQRLQDLDFADRGEREASFVDLHSDLLERVQLAAFPLASQDCGLSLAGRTDFAVGAFSDLLYFLEVRHTARAATQLAQLLIHFIIIISLALPQLQEHLLLDTNPRLPASNTPALACSSSDASPPSATADSVCSDVAPPPPPRCSVLSSRSLAAPRSVLVTHLTILSRTRA